MRIGSVLAMATAARASSAHPHVRARQQHLPMHLTPQSWLSHPHARNHSTPGLIVRDMSDIAQKNRQGTLQNRRAQPLFTRTLAKTGSTGSRTMRCPSG